MNEFRFQYARRGLSYFYNTQIPGGSDPAVNIPGFAYFGREPYSYIQRVEQRYQFTDNFSWTIGRHNTKFGADFNYLPLTATFTVNYGGVYDFGNFPPSYIAAFGFVNPAPGALPDFPGLSPVQAYGAGLPGEFVQGLGSPSDSFNNIPIGAFWQDSWRVSHNVTLNYGVRYDVEIPAQVQTAARARPSPPTTCWDCRKAFRPTRTTSSRASAWHGIPRATARPWSALRTESSTITRCSASISSATLPTVRPAANWLLAAPASAVAPGNPGNLNAWPIFQGLQGQAACAPSVFPQANANLGYLPNQQQFQSLNFPQSVFLNQNYLNLNLSNPARQASCPWPSSPSAIRSRRTLSTPMRSKPISRSSAISAAASP